MPAFARRVSADFVFAVVVNQIHLERRSREFCRPLKIGVIAVLRAVRHIAWPWGNDMLNFRKLGSFPGRGGAGCYGDDANSIDIKI